MSILVLPSSQWGKVELVALHSLSYWCLNVIVVWLFLAVPWVCLQFVIVVFLTYYFRYNSRPHLKKKYSLNAFVDFEILHHTEGNLFSFSPRN